MLNSFILLLFFISMLSGQLRFNVEKVTDGAMSMLIKTDKAMRYQLGEDGKIATPYGLAVADGIGGAPFLSFYLANYLTIFAAESFIICQNPKIKFGETITNQMNLAIEAYQKNTAQILDKSPFRWQAKIVQKLHRQAAQGASSTIVTAFIDNNSSKIPKLKIFNRGDSSIALFAKQKSTIRPDHYFYVPRLVSKSEPNGFNSPKHYTANTENKQITKANFEEANINEGDIVIIGSDGFFDNVHLSLISYVLNWIVFQLSNKPLSKWEWKNDIKTLAKAYCKFLTQPEFSKKEEVVKFKASLVKDTPVQQKELKEEKSTSSCFPFFCLFGKQSKKEITVTKPLPTKSEMKGHINRSDLASKRINNIDTVTSFGGCTSKNFLFSPDTSVPSNSLISDCVIKASDEMFSVKDDDNDDNEDSIKIEKEFKVSTVSAILKELAFYFSLEENYFSPFYLESLFSGEPMPSPTGKPDDITVIAAMAKLDDSVNEEVSIEQSPEVENWTALVKNWQQKIDGMMDEDLNYMLEISHSTKNEKGEKIRKLHNKKIPNLDQLII